MSKATLVIEEGAEKLNSILDMITDVVVPDSVKTIGEWTFYRCKSLTRITIPDSVTEICRYAFCECNSLTDIVIPTSVTSIGDAAFDSCSSLTELTIPDSVSSIGFSVFSDCSSLKAIYIDKEKDSLNLGYTRIPKDCKVYWKGEFEEKRMNKPTTSHPYLTTNLNVYSINGSVTCTDRAITEAVIPEYVNGIQVTSIDDWAFGYCASLTSITFGNNITSIGYSAFAHCTALKELTIPDSVTFIEEYAFYECSSLKAIYIDKEKGSLDLSKTKIPNTTKIYWRGEF